MSEIINMKIKQTFLRKEIIEKGYDPLHFAEYLSKMKKQGINIENWLITELEKMVINYKAEPLIFFKKKIKDHSQDLQIINDNSKDFKIKTSKSSIEVVRSFSDLQWTINQLPKEITYLYFMKDIQKNYFIDDSKKIISEKKLIMLKHFVKFFYVYSEFTKSELLRNFFIMDKENFNIYQKKYKVVPDFKNSILNKFYFDTFLNIIKKNQEKKYLIQTETNFKESVKSYVILLKKYLNTSGNLSEKFSKLINRLSLNFKETSKTLLKLTETSLELKNQVELLDTKLYTKFENLKNTFSNLQDFFKNWNTSIETTSLIIKKEIRDPFLTLSSKFYDLSNVK